MNYLINQSQKQQLDLQIHHSTTTILTKFNSRIQKPEQFSKFIEF